jgi:hypothetical protein
MATPVSIYRGTPKAVNRKLLLIILIIELIVMGIILLARWNESRTATNRPPMRSPTAPSQPRAGPGSASEHMLVTSGISVRPVAWYNLTVSRW